MKTEITSEPLKKTGIINNTSLLQIKLSIQQSAACPVGGGSYSLCTRSAQLCTSEFLREKQKCLKPSLHAGCSS